MRVFLSHSSKDKGFVEGVASLLKPGTYELDSETFDAGLVNSEAIINALRRCDIFCLFLSKDSIASSYVDFEILLGVELLAKGTISKMLIICLDEAAFQKLTQNIRFFNIVRRGNVIEGAARLIQGALISANSAAPRFSHPFIGREDSLRELEQQVTDPGRPATKAIFASGNFGSGRRTLLQKFYQNQYPQVGTVFPTINIEEYQGLEELFRKLLAKLRPSMNSRELITRISEFERVNDQNKKRMIAELLSSVLETREAVMLQDAGGLLLDSGAFQPEFEGIINLLQDRPHPPLAIAAPRMVPLKFRREKNDVAYVSVKSLNREDSFRLAARLFKDLDIIITSKQISEVVELGDGHPYNFYRIMEEVKENGLEVFLANPSNFINWKHRYSSEYLSKIILSENEAFILSILVILPSLDFEAIVDALPFDASVAAEMLLRLSNLHLVEHTNDVFSISPPLRIAVERDSRIRLPPNVRLDALNALAKTLVVRIDEGTASLDLVDSAVLASIESGYTNETFLAALLLPSHYVWLAKRKYDQRDFKESIRLAGEALKGASRLSASGAVAACRFMCLSAARIGEIEIFKKGMEKLESMASDDWARSNIAFLKGFNSRFKGNLPVAEDFFRSAYDLSLGNFSAAREIAAICLARGKLDEAERFAREAIGNAPSNPYVIDILLAVLIKKMERKSKSSPEVRELFDRLEAVDSEGGRSFYATRKAELEHLWGDNNMAKKLIEGAIEKTPAIFEPRRIYAQILLKENNMVKALSVLNWMKDKVYSRDPSERRSNYRSYLEIYAQYLTEIGQYDDAKAIFDDRAVFTAEEKRERAREIEIAQAYHHSSRQ